MNQEALVQVQSKHYKLTTFDSILENIKMVYMYELLFPKIHFTYVLYCIDTLSLYISLLVQINNLKLFQHS